jgi:protein PET100
MEHIIQWLTIQRIPTTQSGVREELHRIKMERLAKRAAQEEESER